MGLIKYRVDIDFEKPSISNSTYGVYNGVMRLVTGDEPYSIPSGGFAKDGLLKSNNVRSPSKSINIHGGGLISMASGGSLSISNMDDISGFFSENQLFPSYKFVKIYEITQTGERLDFSGIITTYTISPSEISFSLGSRFQRILTKTPSKKASSLAFGIIGDNQKASSKISFPVIAGIHQGLDSSRSFPTSVFSASTYDNINPYLYDRASAGQSSDSLNLGNLRADTLADDSMNGKFLYLLSGEGDSFAVEIVGNKKNTFWDDITNFNVKTPFETYLLGFSTERKFNLSNQYPSESNTDIEGFIYEVNQTAGAIDPQTGVSVSFTPDYLSEDPLPEPASKFPQWNMPQNPQLNEDNNDSINPYDPKMVYPYAERSSQAVILDVPAGGVELELGDASISEITSIQNITEFDSYATTTGNKITFQKECIGPDFTIEIFQPVGSPDGSFNSQGISSSKVINTSNSLEVWEDTTLISFNQPSMRLSSTLANYTPYDFYKEPRVYYNPADANSRSGYYRFMQMLPNAFFEWNHWLSPTSPEPEPPTWGPQFANNSDYFLNNPEWMSGDIKKASPTNVWRRSVVCTRLSDIDNEPLIQLSQTSRETFTQTQRFEVSDTKKVIDSFNEIGLSFGIGGSVIYDPRNNNFYNKSFASRVFDLDLFLSANIVITAKTKSNKKSFLLFDSETIYMGGTKTFGWSNIEKTTLPDTPESDENIMFKLDYFFGAGRQVELNEAQWNADKDHNVSKLIKIEDVMSNLEKLTDVEFLECSVRFEFNIVPAFADIWVEYANGKAPRLTLIHEMNLHKLQWQFINKLDSDVTLNDNSLDVEYRLEWTGVSDVGGQDSFLIDVVKDTLLTYDKRPLGELGAGWDDYRGIPLLDGYINQITSTQNFYNSLCALGDFAMWVDEHDKINIKKWTNDLGSGVVSDFTLSHVFDESNIEQGSLNKALQKATNEIYNQVYITFKISGSEDVIINIDGTLEGPFPDVTDDWQSFAEGVTDYNKAKMWWERLAQANLRSPNNKIYEKSIEYIRDRAGIDQYIDYVTSWHTFQKLDIPFSVPMAEGVEYNLMEFCSFSDEWITGQTLTGSPVTFYGWITSIKHDSNNNNVKLVFTSYIDPREMCVLTTIDEGFGDQNPFYDSVDEGTGDQNPYNDFIDQQFDLSCNF